MCASNRYNLLGRASCRMRMPSSREKHRVHWVLPCGNYWEVQCLLVPICRRTVLKATLPECCHSVAHCQRVRLKYTALSRSAHRKVQRINKDIPISKVLANVQPKVRNDGKTFKGSTLRYIYCSFKLVKCFQICSKKLTCLSCTRSDGHIMWAGLNVSQCGKCTATERFVSESIWCTRSLRELSGFTKDECLSVKPTRIVSKTNANLLADDGR